MNAKMRDLLFLSSENSRVKIKELSKNLNMSSQLTKYQLKNLVGKELMHRPYCIFDYSYFGMILFKTYFKGGYIGEKDKAKIIKDLTSNEYVISIYEFIGSFDLAIEILAPNPSRFNKIIKEMTNESKTLKNYKIVLNIVSHLYPKAYLARNKELVNLVQKDIIIGGDREVQSFTDNEHELIREIALNPLGRYSTLSRLSDMNIKTMHNTWKELKKKNVVKGFKYMLNNNQLEIYRFRLFLKLHNITREQEEKLIEYLKEVNEVVGAHKTLGDWDIEIDIESFDKTQIRKITMDLRENFSEIIETFDIMEFINSYMRRYLPRYIFDKI